MGTLERARETLRLVRRMPPDVIEIAASAIGAAIVYRDELVRRHARPTTHPAVYHYEIQDLEEAIHRLAMACPDADPEAVWRGWTRPRAYPDGSVQRQRVTVKRIGQAAVLRSSRLVKRTRARVEDAFAVDIDGVVVGRWLRAAAMKQARWATLVRADGTLPLGETNTGRRWRLYRYLLRRNLRREARLAKRNAVAHRRAKPGRPMLIRGRDVTITLRTPWGVKVLGPTDVNVDDEFSIAPRRLPPRR